MAIRRAEKADLEEIIELFSNTIRTVNVKDYNREQIDTWAGARNKDAWGKKIEEQHFLVKDHSGKIVGFSSIDKTGYLDFMYVHADYQRRGIAKELLTAIVAKAKEQQNEKIWASVSITAQPFFLKSGFTVKTQETKELNGVKFINAIMEKQL